MPETEAPDEVGGGKPEQDAKPGTAARTKTRTTSGGAASGAPVSSPDAAAGPPPPPPVHAPPPAPGSAPPDAESDRGISGALALWGPLIIIGFLVLVLNTNDAPETPAPSDTASAPLEGVVPVEAAPAPPTTETAATAGEEAATPPAAPQVVTPPAAAQEPPTAPETTATKDLSGASEPGDESALAAAGQSAATEDASAGAQEASSAEEAQSTDVVGELGLDTVLEVARSVIGQDSDEASPEIATDSGAAAPSLASPVAAAPLAAAPPAAPAPPTSGTGNAGAAASAPAVPSGYRAELPIWSTGPHPWAAAPSSEEGTGWNDGTGAAMRPAHSSDWPPPPPESVAAMPPFPSAAMVPGTGYWPRPPVLVPCVAPYYWCIAPPLPLYHPAAPGTY